jgi:hypothetical protein
MKPNDPAPSALTWSGLATLMLVALTGLASPAILADKPDQDDQQASPSANTDWIEDLRAGEITLAGDDAAVDMLILERHIPIPYDYIATLMRTPNAFGQGVACIICHSSKDPAKSYRGLDLSTCEGILLGADSVAKGVDKATKIVIPGQPLESGLYQHLVEDRTPPGIPPTNDRDHPNTLILLRWIEQGANCQ